jgi:hypothetical protein
MKKIMMGFFFALATMALLLGCKKEMIKNNSIVSDDVHVKKLRTWYESATSDTKSKTVEVNGVLTKVEEIPAWDETRHFPNEGITITPIKIGVAKQNTPAFKYLVARNDAQGQITDINYYRLIEGKQKPTNKFLEINNLNFISKIIADKDLPNDFTGILLKYSGNNNLSNTTSYKNGLVFNTKTEKNKLNETEETYAPIDECSTVIIDSWWVLYENGNIVSIEYLYSTTYTVCPPGGGGGGGNNTTTCSALFTDMYSGTHVTSAVRSITVINETETTRTALYEWGCLTNTFAGWVIFSKEKAVHIKTNNPDPNLQWQFQSATHEGIGLVGIVAGGSVEPSVTASNFTMGLYNMHVYLSLSVKYSLVCSGFPLSTTLTYSPHRGFNLNQGQL